VDPWLRRQPDRAASYVPVGSKQSVRRQIGMPVENRLFFAGEATSQFFPSTVHGAFLSGVRAAYEIKLADAKADLMKDGQGGVSPSCPRGFHPVSLGAPRGVTATRRIGRPGPCAAPRTVLARFRIKGGTRLYATDAGLAREGRFHGH